MIVLKSDVANSVGLATKSPPFFYLSLSLFLSCPLVFPPLLSPQDIAVFLEEQGTQVSDEDKKVVSEAVSVTSNYHHARCVHLPR